MNRDLRKPGLSIAVFPVPRMVPGTEQLLNKHLFIDESKEGVLCGYDYLHKGVEV